MFCLDRCDVEDGEEGLCGKDLVKSEEGHVTGWFSGVKRNVREGSSDGERLGMDDKLTNSTVIHGSQINALKTNVERGVN